MNVRFIERELFVDGRRHELPYPIDDAVEYEEIVVILFDPDSATEDYGPFHNLIAIDSSGRTMWEADLPTSNPGDRYYKISSKEPFVVYSTESYDCVIDLSTGHIINRTFTK
jgi:hypothetical protein